MFVGPIPSSSYGAAITPHATTLNLLNARFIQNVGTAGEFVIRQDVADSGAVGTAPTAATTRVVYLGQGQTIELTASDLGVNAIGMTPGVSLVGYW